MTINKFQVNGRSDEVTGAIKEIAGEILDNHKLEKKGKIQKNIGKAQAAIGDAKSNIEKIVNAS